MLDRLCSSHR